MRPEFWHDKWNKNEIGFHLNAAHPWLVEALSSMALPHDLTIFVPLCGKTHDIDFLLNEGFKVVANELSELAVIDLFLRLGITPEVTIMNSLGTSVIKQYASKQLNVYVGDFFELTFKHINNNSIDWVYDRAAIIALPFEMRQNYSKKICEICPDAQQLLMTLDYPQQQMSGPPFSVTPDEVVSHYAEFFKISVIKERDILDKEPRFKQRGLTEFNQRLFLLSRL